MVLFVDKKWLQKKEKGHLVGYYMMRYTARLNSCFSKLWPPNNHHVYAYL